ncbi:transposase [Nocardia sp. CNY236]|uniref:transposase n=1 Tax=Nocardia sp. CNY236 TaxID=1169152 RepID=UPI0004146ADE
MAAPVSKATTAAAVDPVDLSRGIAQARADFFDTKIHLVVDRHPVHRARTTTAWMHTHRDRIELHYLPAYAPHLNPDELVNADLKRVLADENILNPDQMELAVRSFFRRIQKLPGHVRGYFQAPHSIYASTI